MRDQRRNLIVVVTTLVALAETSCLLLGSEHGNPELLSIEKSLLPAFAGKYYSQGSFPFNRLDPNIQEYIHFYLEEDDWSKKFSGEAIALLGYIGRKEDISFVDKYIQNFLIHSGNDERLRCMNYVANGAGRFSGMMIKRRIEGAKSFFEKYAVTSAWLQPSDDPHMVEMAELAYSVFMVKAYQFSRADYVFEALQARSATGVPFFHESHLDRLRNLKEDLYTLSMEPVEIPIKKLDKSLDRDLEQAEYIQHVMRKETYAQWRKAQRRQKVVPGAQGGLPDSFESVDLSKTTEGACLRSVAYDAVDAFGKVSNILLGGDAEVLPIRKETLRDLHGRDVDSAEELRVDINVEAKISKLPESMTPERKDGETVIESVVTKNKESADVAFSFLDTAKDGDVTIDMKRDGNKWYWSSIGDPNVDASADIVEDEYLTTCVCDAMVAYTEISQTLIGGDYDLLTIPVLDNGELIPLEKRRKDKEEMGKALEMEREILAELTESELDTYSNHHIQIRLKATLTHGQTSAETDITTVSVNGYETADVKFVIQNAAEAYTKHAPKRSGTGCFDGAGGLWVYMKRINGKWYWNPFGW